MTGTELIDSKPRHAGGRHTLGMEEHKFNLMQHDKRIANAFKTGIRKTDNARRITFRFVIRKAGKGQRD